MSVTGSLPGGPPEVRLGSLLAVAGLTHLGGAGVDPRTPIAGACLAEGADGLTALEPGWLIATDGWPLGSAHDAQLRAFVREAAARQASGLVVRLGPLWSQAPAALLDEARHAGLPVLGLPHQATLSTFLRQVNGSTGIHDVAVLSTAMGLQTELIGALSVPDLEGELVRRIAASLDVSAILYDGRRTMLAAQGDAPVHLIGQALDLDQDGEARRRVGRWDTSIASVASDGRATHLVLAWPDNRDIDPALLRSTHVAVRQLLRAHARTLAAARLQDQVQRGQALSELLDGVTDTRLQRMRDGLVLLHFPLEGTFQVHIIAGPASRTAEATPDPVLSLVQDVAESTRTAVLLGVYRGDYAVLHGASDAFTDELITLLPETAHGASSAFHDLLGAPAALRQAQMSLSTGARTGMFTPFHRVGFIDFILGNVPEDTLSDRAAEVLGDLADSDLHLETLIEYLRCGLDIQQTGRAMHLHPNSIRYRLSRAEEQLGRPINDPETITLLYLTLHDRINEPARPAPRRAVP